MVHARFLQFARSTIGDLRPPARPPRGAPPPQAPRRPPARDPGPAPANPAPVLGVGRNLGRAGVLGGALVLGVGGASYLHQQGAAAVVREQEEGATRRELGQQLIDTDPSTAAELFGDAGTFTPRGGKDLGTAASEVGGQALWILGLLGAGWLALQAFQGAKK